MPAWYGAGETPFDYKPPSRLADSGLAGSDKRMRVLVDAGESLCSSSPPTCFLALHLGRTERSDLMLSRSVIPIRPSAIYFIPHLDPAPNGHCRYLQLYPFELDSHRCRCRYGRRCRTVCGAGAEGMGGAVQGIRPDLAYRRPRKRRDGGCGAAGVRAGTAEAETSQDKMRRRACPPVRIRPSRVPLLAYPPVRTRIPACIADGNRCRETCGAFIVC